MTQNQTMTRSIAIDGMTGDACVGKVTGALKGVPNVATHSVKVGSASIGADQAGCAAACAAVGAAGFKAKESADRVVHQGAKAADGTSTEPNAKRPDQTSTQQTRS